MQEDATAQRCTASAEILLIQPVALVGKRPQLFEGAEHQVVILQNPSGFPAHNPQCGGLLPALDIEHQVNPQAAVAFFDTHNGDAQRVKASSLVPEAEETPRGEVAAHVLEDLIEIRDGDKAADDLTIELCHQGHCRDDREP